MPRQIATDKNGVRYTVDSTTNEWRPLTAEENGAFIPVGALDEQGVTDGERWMTKNLTANPPAAKLLLENMGYQVQQYGDGFNFYVRKNPQDPWKVLDPEKGGLPELWKDFTDLFGDIGVGVATGLGTLAGGGLASAATGAAAGAGAEALRQGIGAAAGVPQNLGVAEIVGSGVGGAIAPGVGRAIGGAVRGAVRGIKSITKPGGALGRGAEIFTTRVTDVKGAQGLEISDIMLKRNATLPKPLFTPEDAVSLYRQHIDEIANPSIDVISKTVSDSIPDNAVVNLAPLVKQMTSLVDIFTPTSKEIALAGNKSRLQMVVINALRPPSKSAIAAEMQAAAKAAAPALPTFGLGTPAGAAAVATARAAQTVSPKAVQLAFKQAQREWISGLKRTPAKAVQRIKQVLQEEVSGRQGFGAVGVGPSGAVTPVKKPETRLLANFSRQLTQQFHKGVPATVKIQDSILSSKISARNGMRTFFGAKKLGEADPSVSNISGALNPNNSAIRRALRAYDQEFPGLGFEKITRDAANLGRGITRALPRKLPGFPGQGGAAELAEQVRIGQQFTPVPGAAEEFGLPGPFGKFTATGGVFGASLVGGAVGGVGGGAVGGKEGAVIGGLAGLSAPFVFSPSTLVRLAPFTTRANAAVNRMASGVDKVLATKMLRETTRVLASGAAQATGRRIASQDAQGRRRAVFIGK